MVGIATALEERQDLVMALRSVQEDGAKVTPSEPKIDVAFGDEVATFIASCIPYIGSAATLLEVYEGRDSFCRKLSTTARIIAGLSVGLPFIKILAKGGYAAYTSARLAFLYGRDAVKWSMMVQMGVRATADPLAAKAVFNAGILAREEQVLTSVIIKEAEKGLEVLMGKSKPSRKIIIDSESALFEELRNLIRAKPTLKTLDEFSLERVVKASVTEKGTNIDIAKGKLLEEFTESQILPMLRDKFGPIALFNKAGIKTRYFPGRTVRLGKSREEITDGIFAQMFPKSSIKPEEYGSRSREQISNIVGLVEIPGMIECKAGKASSDGLRYEYELTSKDLEAINAAAQEIMTGKATANKYEYLFTLTEKDKSAIKAALSTKAAKAGKPFTLKDIARLSQILKDLFPIKYHLLKPTK